MYDLSKVTTGWRGGSRAGEAADINPGRQPGAIQKDSHLTKCFGEKLEFVLESEIKLKDGSGGAALVDISYRPTDILSASLFTEAETANLTHTEKTAVILDHIYPTEITILTISGLCKQHSVC